MATGLDYPLRATAGNLAIVSDADLCEAHIRFVLDSYLPDSFLLFETLPNPVALAEDLRLILIQYIPEAEFRCEGELSSNFEGKIQIDVFWEYLGVTGTLAVTV